ncbi:MAG: hypothetical protein ACOY5F_13305 [Pseudomonadota bacterium]
MIDATEILNQLARDRSTQVSDAVLQALVSGAVRAYAARVERGGNLQPFPSDTVTATDVVVTTTAMLAAVDVGIFELSMWQSVKGQPTTN